MRPCSSRGWCGRIGAAAAPGWLPRSLTRTPAKPPGICFGVQFWVSSSTVGFAIADEDQERLTRLVEHFGGGNRSAYLRATLPVMESLARAERLRELQARNAERAAAAGLTMSHCWRRSAGRIRAGRRGVEPARAGPGTRRVTYWCWRWPPGSLRSGAGRRRRPRREIRARTAWV